MQHSEPSPAENWDRDSTRRALDELFTVARTFNLSKAYLELMEFVGRFWFYSPFNAMLIYTQMPGARFVAPAHRWARQFRRQIKVGARPLVILQPMGPVLFVFDVTDTQPLPDAPALPAKVERLFDVLHGRIGDELEQTIERAKRDGVNISERAHGSQRAGSIQTTRSGGYLDVTVATKPQAVIRQVERRYELLLNSNLTRAARYATLVHELGHLYCGHLDVFKARSGFSPLFGLLLSPGPINRPSKSTSSSSSVMRRLKTRRGLMLGESGGNAGLWRV
jgi:hypothetical protein